MSTELALATCRVLKKVAEERDRQDDKWGKQNHGPSEWMAILMEEVGELAHEANHLTFNPKAGSHTRKNYIDEAIQVAAVAVALVECIERQTEGHADQGSENGWAI